MSQRNIGCGFSDSLAMLDTIANLYEDSVDQRRHMAASLDGDLRRTERWDFYIIVHSLRITIEQPDRTVCN